MASLFIFTQFENKCKNLLKSIDIFSIQLITLFNFNYFLLYPLNNWLFIYLHTNLSCLTVFFFKKTTLIGEFLKIIFVFHKKKKVII